MAEKRRSTSPSHDADRKAHQTQEIDLFIERQVMSLHQYFDGWPMEEQVSYYRRKLNQAGIEGGVENVVYPVKSPSTREHAENRAACVTFTSKQCK